MGVTKGEVTMGTLGGAVGEGEEESKVGLMKALGVMGGGTGTWKRALKLSSCSSWLALKMSWEAGIWKTLDCSGTTRSLL